MVDKIKHIFYRYFQQAQSLNIRKHAVHNIHRLAGNCPACPCVKTALSYIPDRILTMVMSCGEHYIVTYNSPFDFYKSSEKIS